MFKKNELYKFCRKEAEKLSNKYEIDIELYMEYKENSIFDGTKALNPVSGNFCIIINEANIKELERAIHTVRHEFRHIWQDVYFPEVSKFWRSVIAKQYGQNQSYYFSTIELDAERFAISNCELDDSFLFDLFQECSDLTTAK